MRSTSAWGDIQMGSLEGKTLLTGAELAKRIKSREIKRIVSVKLNAGIGIDFNKDTGQLFIAVVFFNEADNKDKKHPFLKSEAHFMLNQALDTATEKTLLWKGIYTGPKETIKKDLFVPVTSAFKKFCEGNATVFQLKGNNRVEVTVLSRHWEDVVVIRRCIIDFLMTLTTAKMDTDFTPDADFGTIKPGGTRGRDLHHYLKLRADLAKKLEEYSKNVQSLRKEVASSDTPDNPSTGTIFGNNVGPID